jgi:hypothetical protein
MASPRIMVIMVVNVMSAIAGAKVARLARLLDGCALHHQSPRSTVLE